MDFARKQLEKYGWSEGKGLGRNEDGISQALKPKLKFDNAGIGHEVGEQFTNNWWERVFNNAANNINVKSEKNGIKLELCDEPVEISTKNYSVKDFKKNKNLEYGSFLKTERFTERGMEKYDVKAPEPVLAFNSLTDEELFAACGGRTAHKGARHGLKLTGKLSRIEKQEKLLLKKMKNVSLTEDVSNLEKKVKKLKKHKEDASSKAQEPESSNKKKKNKRKSVSFSSETVIKYYVPDIDTSHESIKDDPLPVVDPNQNNYDEGIEQDIDETINELSDNQKSFEQTQVKFNDLSKAERKKLKKKRKLEKKKTATSLFIEEVRDEMNFDDNGKKRKLVMDFETKQNSFKKFSKKTKYVPEQVTDSRKDKKIMKSIVASLDHFCKISDDD